MLRYPLQTQINYNMKKRFTNMRMKNFTGILVALFAVTMLFSCSNDDSDNGGKAGINVRLTDAPGDYSEVHIDVLDVMVKSDDSESEEGWVSLGAEPKGINLLDLTGGVTELLADTEIEAGYLSQIRLVLGTDNYLVLSGDDGTDVNSRQPLSTPSAQQSGLKVKVDQELEAGVDYEFLLDFDVDKSVVTAGSSGGYVLKPVIRATATAETGSIVGDVHPTTFQSEIKAQSATQTISAYTNANGEFSLNGVPAGIYKITITPALASGLQAKVMTDIEVSAGANVDLETIFFN